MDMAFMVTSFVTLFVIIDPIGLTPLFVALTQGMSNAQRKRVAIRSIVTGFIILVVFTLFGEAVLGFVGISMPAFRIAGGILLFLTALEMLFQMRTKRRQDNSDEEIHDDPSIFPLAIPLIAGPGAITTVILISGSHPGFVGYGETLIITIAVLAIVAAFFMMGSFIERGLGKTGINVVTRILGMLLAALSVQFVLEGITSFIALS